MNIVINVVAKELGKFAVKDVLRHCCVSIATGIGCNVAVAVASKSIIKRIMKQDKMEAEFIEKLKHIPMETVEA